MKKCWICNKEFHPLGFARHMAKHRDEGLMEIRLAGHDIVRNDFTADRFHVVTPEGNKLGLYTWNEAIRIGLEKTRKNK